LIGEILHFQNRINKFFKERKGDYQNLEKLVEINYYDLKAVEKEIKSIFTPERTIADNASKRIEKYQKSD